MINASLRPSLSRQVLMAWLRYVTRDSEGCHSIISVASRLELVIS